MFHFFYDLIYFSGDVGMSGLCILLHSLYKVNISIFPAEDIVTWYTAVKLALFFISQSPRFFSRQPTNLPSETAAMQCCLFLGLYCHCSSCCLCLCCCRDSFLNMYFPLKVFWRWHRLPEHGRLTCRTSNFSACHGGSPSGHRYAQRDLLIGGC